MNRWIFALAALAVPITAACTVGGAGSPRFMESDDPSPGTREAPTDTVDRPPRAGGSSGGSSSSSSSSGSTGACPKTCAGRYSCTDNEGKRSTITFREKDGACDGSGLTLSCDGRLTAGGQTVGTWSQSGTGLTLTAGGASLNCVASGGDDNTSPPVTTTVPPPPQVPDAGPQPPSQG